MSPDPVKALVAAARRVVDDWGEVATGAVGINDLTAALAPFEHRYMGTGGMAGAQRSARCSCGWSYIFTIAGYGLPRTPDDTIVRAWARHALENGERL